MCQALLWMLTMEGCPDFSYTGSVFRTLTSSSPYYLSSLLLSICGATRLGQATVHSCLDSYASLLTCLPAPTPTIPCSRSSQGLPLPKSQKFRLLGIDKAPLTPFQPQ